MTTTSRCNGTDFAIPSENQATVDALDAFIEAEIVPLRSAGDNIRSLGHRPERARTRNTRSLHRAGSTAWPGAFLPAMTSGSVSRSQSSSPSWSVPQAQ